MKASINGPWWFEFLNNKIDALTLRVRANEKAIQDLDARVTALEAGMPVDQRAVIFTAGEPVDEEEV